MPNREGADHLSEMSTAWTLLFQAHEGATESARAARRELVQRYGGPVSRYLRAALGDPEAADELYQEFALKFVRGDFKRAHPDRGRFRDFLKTVLYHLIVDYHKRQRRRPQPLAAESEVPAPGAGPAADPDRAFAEAWRAELLARAWEGLARYEQETGQRLCTVLRLRTDHPDLRSPKMAERLGRDLGQPVTAGWVRKRLHLARAKFTELLVNEVQLTLGAHDEEALAAELLDLGLLDYCRPALQDRDNSG